MVSVKALKQATNKTSNKPQKNIKMRLKSKKPQITISSESILKASKNDEVIKKKSGLTRPSKYISENIVTSCLAALEKLNEHHSKKNVIFGDETQIFMEIRCIKIPNTKGNIKLLLPHSTVASSGEVCLITPDLKKGKKIDHEPTVDHWEELLRDAGVTAVKTVLPMRQLRVEYDQYELKRRLLTQHDFIMVDTRVLNHVSHILGKMFFKKHNMLLPVKISDKKEDLKKDIDVGLRTAMLRLSEGLTSTLLVGHTNMPQNHLKENILAVVKALNGKFPGGEANIRSLSIKLPLSLSLPLYVTLRPSNSIRAPKLKHPKPKAFVEYEDELTTILGHTVRVAPDGTVHIKKIQETEEQGSNDSEMEEDNGSGNERVSDAEEDEE